MMYGGREDKYRIPVIL